MALDSETESSFVWRFLLKRRVCGFQTKLRVPDTPVSHFYLPIGQCEASDDSPERNVSSEGAPRGCIAVLGANQMVCTQ